MTPATKAASAAILSEAIADRATILEMRAIIKASLNGALNLCQLKASTLKALDADAVMIALRHSFDPTQPSQVQDCFTDAFHQALADTSAGESVTERKTLPSGCPL